ncbi:hypothetical protein EGM51_09755 [Verrucomicrobia bacterium S94]|nr:hypothetical protein EGM51_09755 [Verrucomicrobia bacterium S94]
MVEIKRRDEERVQVVIEGTARQFPNKDAAYEFLRGEVRKLEAVVNTAIDMFEIHDCERLDDGYEGEGLAYGNMDGEII